MGQDTLRLDQQARIGAGFGWDDKLDPVLLDALDAVRRRGRPIRQNRRYRSGSGNRSAIPGRRKALDAYHPRTEMAQAITAVMAAVTAMTVAVTPSSTFLSSPGAARREPPGAGLAPA